MIPLKTIEAIVANLEMINRINGVNFTPRFRENYVYIDITERMITSYYCRIEYNEHNEFLDVQFYDPHRSRFESGNIRFKKERLENSLELILIKHESYK